MGVYDGTNIGGTLWISGTSNGLGQSIVSEAGKLGFYGMSARTTSTLPPASDVVPSISIATDANWRSAVVYSAPDNLNVLVMTAASRLFSTGGSVNTLLVTSGGLVNTIPPGPVRQPAYGYLDGAPRYCIDVTNFGNRPIAWRADGITNRVQWPIEGDPTNWTGFGSGSQDLTDMAGDSTRIFAQEDQMVLASSDELWRGRYVGPPYFFSFSRINGRLGMPYERASIQTPVGIFWIDRDMMIYQMVGEQITPFGAPHHSFLQRVVKAPEVAFFVWNDTLKQLRLFYSVSTTSYPTQSLTYDFKNAVWTHEVYGHVFHNGASSFIEKHRMGDVFNGYSGFIGTAFREPLFTSAGTIGQFAPSATSDFGVATDEDAVFAPINANNLTRRVVLEEVRYDFAAKTASSLTASWSTNFGRTSGFSQRMSLSASSNASQVISYPRLNGQYLTPRIESTGGAWQLRRTYHALEDTGKAV
jgi:hypothetical protein